VAEYVSSNGGTSFTLQTHAVSWAPESDGTAGPIVPLLGGDFGAGYVTPNSNPAFQANSLSSPSDDSEGNAASYATLNPAPASAYTVGNLGGEFASQVTGSTGVLGVFEAQTGTGNSPCPSSAPAALVYAYAPITASTTIAQLNTTTGGSGSPWEALAEVDCDGINPAVGGGPSGLGLLETDISTTPETIQYRGFSPASGFAAPVTVASDEQGGDPVLSQDGTGGIYATWLDGGTGVDLAYSSTAGASWTGPDTLSSNSGDPSEIGSLASAVNGSGQGWAVYAANGTEYAQEFDKSDAEP